MSEYQGQIKITKLEIQGRFETFDVLEKEALEQVAIYEDMFEPSLSGKLIIRDALDYGNKIPLVGEEYIIMDIEIPDSGEILVPPFYVYSVEEIKGRKDERER